MRRKNTHWATRASHTTAAARPVSEGALAAVIHRITPMPTAVRPPCLSGPGGILAQARPELVKFHRIANVGA
jgi:hypothetical protein